MDSVTTANSTVGASLYRDIFWTILWGFWAWAVWKQTKSLFRLWINCRYLRAMLRSKSTCTRMLPGNRPTSLPRGASRNRYRLVLCMGTLRYREKLYNLLGLALCAGMYVEFYFYGRKSSEQFSGVATHPRPIANGHDAFCLLPVWLRCLSERSAGI